VLELERDAMSLSRPASVQARIRRDAEVVAVATEAGRWLQRRGPAIVEIDGAASAASGPATPESGHALFHMKGGASLACASCHPEGGDDGRVWDFGDGPRRTPSLRGGLLARGPMLWDGAEPDAATACGAMAERAWGRALGQPNREALAAWLEDLAAPRRDPPSDPEAALRGAEVYRQDAGCVACHDRAVGVVMDVGTGGSFRVPSLEGAWSHAPYLHDGSAATLRDAATSAHAGDTGLTPPELDDLVAHLETL
jgi:cytochrome c peroxidase